MCSTPPDNDYVVGSFNCRKCKVFIRADVGGNVTLTPPTENPSSGKKQNVGAIVGLTFLLAFVILAFVFWICWKRRSSTASEVVVHQQPVVVQPVVRNEQNLKQVENVPPGRQLSPRRLPEVSVQQRVQSEEELEQVVFTKEQLIRNKSLYGWEGLVWDIQQQPAPQREPRRDRVEGLGKGKQPAPQRKPHRYNKVEGHGEGKQPAPQRQPPGDEVGGHREGKQPAPQREPRRDRVEGHREGKQPATQQEPRRDRVERHREGKQPEPQRKPHGNRVIRGKDNRKQQRQRPYQEKGNVGKRERDRQQKRHQQLPREEYGKREYKRPRHGKQQLPEVDIERQLPRDEEVVRHTSRAEAAIDQQNSLGLPNKYPLKYLRKVTDNFREKIGGGGFGKVYKGTMSDGTMIAVKRLKVGGIIDDFMNEVQALGGADHSNLVKLLGYCTERKYRILVYEYMSNGSLDKWIFHSDPEKSLTWPQMKNIIQGIAHGLVYLHNNCDKTILHRDLKPANVVLDDRLNAKLCDFGLAKLLDKDQTSTWTGRAGTRGYMAPEAMEDISITEKVDVYSFGVVVLEVLFGERYRDLVSPGQTNVQVYHLHRLINGSVNEKLRENNKEIFEIGKLAVKCLEEYPHHRPNMSDMLASLQRFTPKFQEPKPIVQPSSFWEGIIGRPS